MVRDFARVWNQEIFKTSPFQKTTQISLFLFSLLFKCGVETRKGSGLEEHKSRDMASVNQSHLCHRACPLSCNCSLPAVFCFPFYNGSTPLQNATIQCYIWCLLSGYGLFNVYSKISSSLFISREKTQLVDDFCLAMAQIGAWRLDFSGWLPKAIGRKNFRRPIIFSTKSQYLQLQTVEVRGYISSTLDYFACVL